MLKLKKFKIQISLEYFIGFSVLLSVLFVFIYLYFESYKQLAEVVRYLGLETRCYFLSSKFDSFLPIILKNISYYEVFEINLEEEVEIKNFKIKIENVSCYTRIENVYGKLKDGKNIIKIENGNISILQT